MGTADAQAASASAGSGVEPVRRRKGVALLNPAAGVAREAAHPQSSERLVAAFRKHGLDVDVQATAAGALQTAAETAREQVRRGEVDFIVVGGGDGSIATVARVLAGTEIPLGILPLGTLNHFAKDLGLPLEQDDAVAVIAAGRMRQVDMAELNGRGFINNSSIGLYPYLVLDRERRRSQTGASKRWAMVLAAWRVLRHFPVRRLFVRAAGWEEPYRTPCVFVGNNAYTLSRRSFGTRESLSRGELCLFVATQQSRAALIGLALRTALGLLKPARDLRAFALREVEISSRRRRLLVALDGEVAIMRQPLRYRSRPAALRVFAPAGRGET